MRLVRLDRIGWQGRVHFLAMASRTMRRVLIDYAKGRAREKRGGGVALTLPSDIAATNAPGSLDDLLALDEALRRLEDVSPRQVRLVECRFFGGLSLEETAEALGVSLATVKRDWLLCRAWLNRALATADTQPIGADDPGDPGPPAAS
jgi:RNA polymerase sigma factor (TIGR02999 family)